MSKTDATRPWQVRNADRLEGPYHWPWPLKDDSYGCACECPSFELDPGWPVVGV